MSPRLPPPSVMKVGGETGRDIYGTSFVPVWFLAPGLPVALLMIDGKPSTKRCFLLYLRSRGAATPTHATQRVGSGGDIGE